MAILVTNDRSGIPQHAMPCDLVTDDFSEDIGFVGFFSVRGTGVMGNWVWTFWCKDQGTQRNGLLIVS